MNQAKKSVEELLTALGDYRCRRGARQALMDMDTCPVDGLMGILEDDSMPLNQRWAAITVLAEAKAEKAVPLLVKIMGEESNLIDEASSALATITGLDCGLKADDWARELGLPVESKTMEEELAEEAESDSPVDEMVSEITESLQMDRKWLLTLAREAVGEQAKSIEWDEAGYVHSDIVLGDREQQILLAPGNMMGLSADKVVIYTECGIVEGLSEEKILQDIGEPNVGEVQLDEQADGIHIAVSHDLSAVGLEAVNLRESMLAVAQYADGIEEKLTGADRV